MAEIGELLQKQLTSEVGKDITISQKNGVEVSGKLVEVGSTYVTIKKANGRKTIFVDMIGGWEILDDEPSQVVSETPASKALPISSTKQKEPESNISIGQETSFEQEVQGRLTYIQGLLAGKINGATIKVRPPDFTISQEDFEKSASKEAYKEWQRIKKKYDYAAQANELGTQFGRIQPIITDVKFLVERYPSSIYLKRYLSYFQFIASNVQEAMKLYRETSLISSAAFDWYNVAALAKTMQPIDDLLACYALQQVFINGFITNYLDAWYLFIGQLQTSDNLYLLKEIYNANQDSLSTSEEQYFLLACIYLLQQSSQVRIAYMLTRGILCEKPVKDLLRDTMNEIIGPVSEKYQQYQQQFEMARQRLISQIKAVQQQAARSSNVVPAPAKQMDAATNGKRKPLPQILPPQQQGSIVIYKKSRGYGFVCGTDGLKYYFHRSSITDDDVLAQIESLEEETLASQEQIAVAFEGTQGPLGYVAVNISRQRVIDQVFELANAYANEGDYIKAVTQIKKVLGINPRYPEAQEMHDKWKVYARIASLPRGSNPYARAKRLQMIEKDWENAVLLYHEAIRQNDRLDSAVMDLASLLMQLERPKEAIQVLEQNRYKTNDQQPIDNMLIDAYQKSGYYSKAISLLQDSLKNLGTTTTKSKQAHIKWRIAICYFRQKDYRNAEYWFREVLKLSLNNKAAQRNLAFCLIKQQSYDEAEQLLNASLPDAESAELLKAIEKARATGQSIQLDEITVDMTLADFSSEISQFTRFFLERCTYEGVPADHVQEKRFVRSDVRRLEELATKLGTRRPRARADYYLSAARIISEHDEWEEDYNQLYKYLCRSFTSRGDAAVIENRSLDSAREWYCEALIVYDGDRTRSRGDEQDAVNAVVRFLFATLGRAHVPTKQVGFENLSIDENLGKILQIDSQRDKVFDAIAYLVFRSQYASNRILTRLFTVPQLQDIALNYLRSKGIVVLAGTVKQRDFFALWKECQLKDLEHSRTISIEIRSVARVELTTASVDESLQRLRSVEPELFFDLDRQRMRELQKILEAMFDLCTQSAFEEQERFCNQIDNRCKDLLQEIEANPTTLSVEELYPIIKLIQEKTAAYREDIYASSVPQLTLRLPRSMESYASSTNYQRIEVQIVIENRMGSSPAESVELIVQEDATFFTVDSQEIKVNGSLRGGEQRILLVPLRITERAHQSQAFSLPVYAQYRTRSEDMLQTPIKGFSINLYPAEQFERIENPYAVYAQGGIVGNEAMFYGRGDLITNIAEAIYEARLQSKSIIIFGQKRSGKSSILYHLEKRLKRESDLLIVNIGSIGVVLDETSPVPMLHQILRNILSKLEFAIEDEVDNGRSFVPLKFPTDIEFYEHPAPLGYFQDILTRFKRAAAKAEDWQGMRIVLLIDEFSYIYGKIMTGRLSEDFMKNWKALLQENLFSVVLAGQDVMPKFKEHFPNEFGITQDQRVNYLFIEDARKLIDEPIRFGGRSGESRYRERAIERIVDLTSGNPFYIQIICNRLVEYMNRKQAKLVTEADVEQVKHELIQGNNPLGWEHFDNLTNSGDTSPDAISEEDARAVLMKIAISSRTGPCSRSSIIVDTQTSVSDILEDLDKREVIETKPGQYYTIRVGLFKEWLLAHQ